MRKQWKYILLNYFSLTCNFDLQGTASEATLVALLGAKDMKIKQVKEQHPDWTENEIISKLVAYCSCEYIIHYFACNYCSWCATTYKKSEIFNMKTTRADWLVCANFSNQEINLYTAYYIHIMNLLLQQENIKINYLLINDS